MTANLAELLGRAAEEAPDGRALVVPATGASYTWSELDAAADRAAQGFGRLGLVAGNRVVLVTGNRPELVVAYFGALRANLVAVPVNPRAATGELLTAVTDSGARLVVADGATVEAARSVLAGIADARDHADEEVRGRTVVPRLVTVDAIPEPGECGFEELLAPAPDEPPLPPAHDPESLAVLLYTSGASARPRAAMLSHRALIANIEQVGAIEPPVVGPDDVVYGVLPLFHVFGLNAVLGPVVHRRATLVLVDGFDPERSLREVQEHGVTVLPVAPAVLAHWRRVEGLGERLSGVRTLLSGSAPLAPEVVDELQERWGITVHQGYGLTEAAPVVTSTLVAGPGTPKRGSVGRAVPGVSLTLVDENGRPPAGEDAGEIWVKGDNLFDGYWPDGAGAPVDGWHATGDVGYLDADGDLFLVDRLREIVVVSGFNVYPSEVEEVLLDVDGVLEAAVVGVPDEETGEAVVAYLRTDVSGAEEQADLRSRVADACARRLARFKHPARVEVVDALPHTATGKIAKGRLRTALRRGWTELLE